jgi:hypothetical protein
VNREKCKNREEILGNCGPKERSQHMMMMMMMMMMEHV